MKLCVALLLGIVMAHTAYADVLSVRADSAEMRDSSNPYVSQVVLIVPRYYPLSINGEADGYYQVSDFWGREGWVEKGAVGAVPAVVVKVDSGNIRKGPGTDYEILFHARQGVAFKVMDEKDGWVKVEHESGNGGWISGELVWGERASASRKI